MGELVCGVIGCMIEVAGMMVLSWKVHDSKPKRAVWTVVLGIIITLPLAIFINVKDTATVNNIVLVIIMLFIIVYNMIIFKNSLKEAMLITCIATFFSVCIEIISGAILILFSIPFGDYILLDCVVFLLMIGGLILIYKKIPFYKIYEFASERKFTVELVVAFYTFIIAYILLTWKVNRLLEIDTMLFLIFFMIVLFIVTYEWRKSYAESLKKQKDIEVITLYSKAFEGLISEIRSRQHEYDNKICALINMHLTIKDYDELVQRQLAYVNQDKIKENNEYIMLLKIADKILSGFLYSKISTAAENGINMDFWAEDFAEHEIKSESDLTSMVGVLIDNAVEACSEKFNHVIITTGSSEDKKLKISVFNRHEHIPHDELKHFFDRGFSTKAVDKEKHGLGLYYAKKLVEQYGGSLLVENFEFEEQNYIRFTLEV